VETQYVLVGDKESLDLLYDKLTKLPHSTYNINIICGGWMSHFIYDIYDKKSPPILRLNMLFTWMSCEWREFIKFIKSKYPKLDIFYYTEEIGGGIYVTNDEKGIYFPSRYILDSWKFGIKYLNDLESLANYIYTLIGVRIKDTSIEGIRNVLKRYAKLESLENKNEDCYYSIDEIIVESG